MARARFRLSAKQVLKLVDPGLYPDGGGLYLQVSRSTDGSAVRRSWVVRYRTQAKKTREMGLGSAENVSLADARSAAEDARRLVSKGADPIEARNAARALAESEAQAALTFAQCAEAYISAHEASWKNAKHRQQWRNTLKTYAFPIFGAKPVNDVDRGDVIAALSAISATKPETAGRLRSRIIAVLEWAVAREYRTAEDPAAWRRYLLKAVPTVPKSKRVNHHPALPYEQVPDLIAALRGRTGVASRALEFVILTAARTSEGIQAEWAEIDLKKAVWTIPAERMKSGREHRVPLSLRAIELLSEMRALNSPTWVFPGPSGGPLSNMALLAVLRRMGDAKTTTHGFRSSFRDWASEETPFAREVAEQALAHVVADQTEAAYRRGDLFNKRRDLMDAWALHCEPKGGR